MLKISKIHALLKKTITYNVVKYTIITTLILFALISIVQVVLIIMGWVDVNSETVEYISSIKDTGIQTIIGMSYLIGVLMVSSALADFCIWTSVLCYKILKMIFIKGVPPVKDIKKTLSTNKEKIGEIA